MGSSLYGFSERDHGASERGLGFGCMCPCSSFVEICARQVGQEKLKPRKRSHEDQSQSLGEASSPLPSASRPAGTNSPADL